MPYRTPGRTAVRITAVLLLLGLILSAFPGSVRAERRVPHHPPKARKAVPPKPRKTIKPTPRPTARKKASGHAQAVVKATARAIIHSQPAHRPNAPKLASRKGVPTAPYRVASVKPIAIKPGAIKPAAAKPAKPTVDRMAAMAVEIVAAGKGRINYNAGVVKAIGMGAIAPPSLKKSRAQDILDAREVAVGDALRNLAMAVSQVRVTANTRVQNYILRNDEIKVRVDSMVKGARVIEEKVLPTSGVYRVVMQLRLRGPDSLLDAIEAAESDARRAAVLADREKAETAAEAPTPLSPGMPAPVDAEYTSLIVDCRGMGIAPSPAPKLFDTRRNEVYGTMKVSADFVNDVGIVSYPRSMDEARQVPRAGRRPLVVRACGIADPHRFHPIISTRDAERARAANESGHFFERTAVIFLVDPIR